MKVKKKERSKKLSDLYFPSLEEDIKRKEKVRRVHGMILKVIKTIILMLFKQSWIWGEKIFPELENISFLFVVKKILN